MEKEIDLENVNDGTDGKTDSETIGEKIYHFCVEALEQKLKEEKEQAESKI